MVSRFTHWAVLALDFYNCRSHGQFPFHQNVIHLSKARKRSPSDFGCPGKGLAFRNETIQYSGTSIFLCIIATVSPGPSFRSVSLHKPERRWSHIMENICATQASCRICIVNAHSQTSAVCCIRKLLLSENGQEFVFPVANYSLLDVMGWILLLISSFSTGFLSSAYDLVIGLNIFQCPNSGSAAAQLYSFTHLFLISYRTSPISVLVLLDFLVKQGSSTYWLYVDLAGARAPD